MKCHLFRIYGWGISLQNLWFEGRRVKRGSFTIEAAILFPFIFGIYALSISYAFDFYESAKNYMSSDYINKLSEVNTFYIEETRKGGDHND